MQFWKTEPHWLIRLDPGEEVIKSLEHFSLKEKVTAGSIRGIGGVGETSLAFYDKAKKEYQTKTFNNEYELLTLLGNFSYLNQKPFVHIHAVLGDHNFNAFGGHVRKMTVAVTAELIVLSDTYQMDRKEDKDIGLNIWGGCKICEIE